MKNLLVIAVLTFGLSLGANAQDYSKGNEEDTDVTQEIKHGAKEAGQEIEQGADKASSEIHDEAKDLTAEDPEKTQAERQNDQADKSKAGEVLSETGGAIKDGASWTWDKVKHNKLTKNVFNQPGDE